MERVCPFCNGLEETKEVCPLCATFMLDGGKIESFYDPYAPYIACEEQLTNNTKDCIHLLYCPSCGYDHRYCVHEMKI